MNRKKLHISDKDITCQVCEKKYDYKRGGSHEKCNTCLVNHRRFERKAKAIEYKGGKCQVCGYDRCHRAMDFHHLNPKEKGFTISGNHCISWNRVKKELDKCVLLCNRCHAELHDGIIDIGVWCNGSTPRL